MMQLSNLIFLGLGCSKVSEQWQQLMDKIVAKACIQWVLVERQSE
jgi:hypothetical protein